MDKAEETKETEETEYQEIGYQDMADDEAGETDGYVHNERRSGLLWPP
jgi:hypothetical protein